MSDGGITKADMRRAIIRTAANAHVRHDRTGGRAIPAAAQDNDGWSSSARRDAFIAFARQAFSRILYPSGRAEGPGAASIHGAAPELTLPLRETSGLAGAAETTPCPRRSGLFDHSFHGAH